MSSLKCIVHFAFSIASQYIYYPFEEDTQHIRTFFFNIVIYSISWLEMWTGYTGVQPPLDVEHVFHLRQFPFPWNRVSKGKTSEMKSSFWMGRQTEDQFMFMFEYDTSIDCEK